ncbi:MAG: hypothetical protein DMF70_12340 [Acidobacteria bacterium]|nr:MAG: hypothetical protein DMF70_12340 [Acidobacteriota bacterium]
MFRAKIRRRFITASSSLILTCARTCWSSAAATARPRPPCFSLKKARARPWPSGAAIGRIEREITEGRLRVILYKDIDEITERAVALTTDAEEQLKIPNDVVFVLVGSDADLTLLRKLGVKTEAGRSAFTEVPVYNPETFETNVPGIYVAGHFTNARHIKPAIDVPRKVVPLIAQSLRAAGSVGSGYRAETEA